MREQERAAILEELGLDKLPEPRYEVPEEHPPLPVGGYMSFRKSLECVDPIATAAFERYIPSSCVVDQGLSARDFHAFWTKGISIRTDLPVPSNERIWRSTGIEPYVNQEQARYLWLAVELRKLYEGHQARRMSLPLVWRTNGHEATVPLLGFIVKLDLTPDDGQTMEERTASMAVLTPPEGGA